LSEKEQHMIGELARALAPDAGDGHPDAATQLAPYVDDQLDDDQRDFVIAHLDICARCREDVDDLLEVQLEMNRGAAARPRPRRYAWLAVAAAAAVAVVIAASFALRERTPRASKAAASPYAALVAAAQRDGHLDPPPFIRELRPGAEVLRAPAGAAHAMPQPAGVVVESDRPLFSWDASAPGVVQVFENQREIARSPRLHATRWTPDRPLPRGVTLAWQVEVERAGGDVEVIPAPPLPPALFRVIDAKSAADIEAARRRFPNDHLLAGILYARAGVQDRAMRELRAAHAAGLEASVGRW
jgi:hypothetical protein